MVAEGEGDVADVGGGAKGGAAIVVEGAGSVVAACCFFQPEKWCRGKEDPSKLGTQPRPSASR